MISPPDSLFELAIALIFFFCVGIGFWGIGYLLRRNGYGNRLDKIDALITKIQRTTARTLFPLSGVVTGLGRNLNRVPLFGSKNNQRIWNDIYKQAEQHFKKQKHKE